MRKRSWLFGYTRLACACLLLATGAGVVAKNNEDHANMAMAGAAPGAITRLLVAGGGGFPLAIGLLASLLILALPVIAWRPARRTDGLAEAG